MVGTPLGLQLAAVPQSVSEPIVPPTHVLPVAVEPKSKTTFPATLGLTTAFIPLPEIENLKTLLLKLMR